LKLTTNRFLVKNFDQQSPNFWQIPTFLGIQDKWSACFCCNQRVKMAQKLLQPAPARHPDRLQ